MVGRALLSRAEPGFTLPAFERLAPPPAPDLLVARLEAATSPGDIVADLHGRGGWVARAAIDRQRRALSLESSPLTRLLAELVLRPPDLRHMDAAFSALSASPHGESSLKLWIGAAFSTRCATCGRSLVADEFTWEGIAGTAGETSRLARKTYRCSLCRDQRGGLEQRQADPDEADVARSTEDIGAAAVRHRLRERFPQPEGADGLAEAILDLHTDRQIVGLAAILDRIEGDLRAAPVEAALRLAFLHAVLPASRLGTGPGRLPAIRIAGGTLRSPLPDAIRERNPWLAFEEGFRTVRGFVQRIEGASVGPLDARFGSDLRSLAEGSATAVIRVASPGSFDALAAEASDATREPGRSGPPPRIRLVLGQPPLRISQDRLAAAYHGTAWVLGREAALLLPLGALAGPAVRAPWSWQAATLRRSLEAVSPHLSRDARAVILLESGGPEALVAAILGGVGAGFRLAEARLFDAEEDGGGIVELTAPGAPVSPGARGRSGRPLEPTSGGAGDPATVPGPGLFSPPERIDARPFAPADVARAVTELAVEVLRERGEPARYERLLGEILVGLDRAGHLRRLVIAAEPPAEAGPPPAGSDRRAGTVRPAPPPVEDSAPPTTGHGERMPGRDFVAAQAARGTEAPGSRDPVDRVLALVRDELTRADQRRVREIEPGRWWLTDAHDLEGAAVPLGDRVEWATYSLLSTAGPLAEAAFFERVVALFAGHDLPDEALVRACLASYRSPASTSSRLATGDDVRGRTVEHTELLARLVDGGHRLGMSVWVGRREQVRRFGNGTLGDLLEHRERNAWLPGIARARLDALDDVDCIWYVRGRTAILFEVEWTAMLGDLVLRRHGRIPPDDRLVRILAVPPERADLVRHKLEASPVLRSAMEASNWHVILWPHLRTWLATGTPRLEGLEPYLGLEPAVERRGEQLGLFERPDALP